MKLIKVTFTSLLVVLFSLGLFAQKAVKLEYSVPIKTLTGEPFADAEILWKAQIYENSKENKGLVWEETGSTSTNAKGLLKIKIGDSDGEAQGPYTNFSEINFGQNKYVIKINFENTDIKPTKIKPIKMNPVMYALTAGNSYHSVTADTAKVALASSTDIDNDGVNDDKDKEKFTVDGAKVDKYGRALDSDKDGVPDVLDKENNTAEGALVNFQGITIAQNLGGAAGAAGAGSMVKGGDFLPVIFFEREFQLSPNTSSLLMVVYNYLKANPSAKLRVIGHTDTFGSEDYNLRLGLMRSQSVVDALVALGIDPERLIAESKGESEPMVDLTTFSVLNFNRRVHFEIAQ